MSNKIEGYDSFLKSKMILKEDSGFDIEDKYLNKELFDYQKEIVIRACKKGRYALFVDTGLGKSLMQLNFGYAINKQLNKNVLFLAARGPSNQIISGTIILIAGQRAYYYYAFNWF